MGIVDFIEAMVYATEEDAIWLNNQIVANHCKEIANEISVRF